MWKAIAIALLAISALYAATQWFLTYNTLAEVLAPLDLSVRDWWLGLDEVTRQEATAYELRRLASPMMLLKSYGGVPLLLLLGAGVVAAVWVKADLRSESTRGRVLLAGLICLPALVGLGLLAGPGMRASLWAVAEAGITNAGLAGATVAQVYVVVLMGATLGVVLAILFAVLLRRARQR